LALILCAIIPEMWATVLLRARAPFSVAGTRLGASARLLQRTHLIE
jgi:hypothetical protein